MMNPANRAMGHLHPVLEASWTAAEKVMLMRDLLDNKPLFPKGLRYAQDVLLRHPVCINYHEM